MKKENGLGRMNKRKRISFKLERIWGLTLEQKKMRGGGGGGGEEEV